MNPLDPNSSFNGPLTPARFKQNNSSQTSNTPPKGPEKSGPSKTKYIPLVLGALALLVLPVTIWQLNTQQDVRQQASEEESVEERAIARVGEELITPADVDLEYTRQQNASTYTSAPTSLKSKILNDLIRKKIIAKEAEARSLTVNDEEVDLKIEQLESFSINPNVNRKIARDIVLEEKLAAFVSGSAIADIAYSQNTSEQTLSLFETILENSIEANNLASIAEPYSTRSSNIGLMEDVTLTEKFPIFSPEINSTLISFDEGDISEIIDHDGRFYIVEIVSSGQGEYESFEDFLNEKIDSEAEILTN